MDALVVGPDPADPRRWRLTGADQGGSLSAMNEYLGYLADRNYSPRTVRTYGYDLLAFAAWLEASGSTVEAVSTDVLRLSRGVPGGDGPGPAGAERGSTCRATGPIGSRRPRSTGGWRRCPGCSTSSRCAIPTVQPGPEGSALGVVRPGERSGLLAHTTRRPAPRRGCGFARRGGCRAALSPRGGRACWAASAPARDLAIAGLMLYCGLRSCGGARRWTSPMSTSAAGG